MKKRVSWKLLVGVQLLVIVAFSGAFLMRRTEARSPQSLLRPVPINPWSEKFTPVPVSRNLPIQIVKHYNRPDLVSDEDLAAVLSRIQPIFPRRQMKPNFIEHAIRTWGVTATFQNPDAVSGQEMLSFLTDTASFVSSWGNEIQPILQERPKGVGIHWGTDQCASYHHDHLLACVTEANAPLDTPVYGPARQNNTLYNVLQEAMRDFRLDERETEWTAMAFGLWIAPVNEWVGSEGRHYSFDLLADRLMRGKRTLGVCSGTHRVYSLVLLIRLDDEYGILSRETRAAAYQYVAEVRDAIMESQFEDGRWPSNWPDGKAAVENPIDDPEYRQVIATGHHLEWMSIAPPDLLIPEPQIKKAMNWVINNTKSKSKEEIFDKFTFYSHVGTALSNWRQVHPADFWREWEAQHPYVPTVDTNDADAPVKTESAEATPAE